MSEQAGTQLLSAVERIIASDAELIERVETARFETPMYAGAGEREWRRAVAAKLVASHATKSAVSGGVTALPAVLPGVGTAIAAASTLADLTLMLKYEVELTLCLTHLYGYDLQIPAERQLAFLLASVSTLEHTNRSLFRDLVSTEATAIWKYTPRQVSKFLLKVMGVLALASISKSALRFVPLVGVVVGASVNKVLTQRVGRRCTVELDQRRYVMSGEDGSAAVAPA